MIKFIKHLKAKLTATALASLLVRSVIKPTYTEEQEELNKIYRLENLKASLPDHYVQCCLNSEIKPSIKFKNKLY